MRRLWFFLLVFVISCGPYQFLHPAEYHGHSTLVAPVYIEDTFNDADRAQLISAIAQWNYSLNGTIMFQVVDDHYSYNPATDPNDVLILLTVSVQEANQHEQYLSLAWTHSRFGGRAGNRIFFVRSRIGDEDLQYVALHELGHSLGALHQSYHGLMNPYYNRQDYECVDRPAVEQVAEYHHLSMDGLRWCH